MSTKLSREQYLSLLHSCAENCTAHYCFFKTYLEAQHPDPRTLCQFKCIEIFKWEESEKVGHDIGYHEAAMRWCNEGLATAFAKVYEEGEGIREVYRRTKAILQLMTTPFQTNAANVSSQSSITITTEL